MSLFRPSVWKLFSVLILSVGLSEVRGAVAMKEGMAEERLSEIRARTLVIIPEKDYPFYRAITEKLASGIKGAKTVVIPGGTHIVNLEKPAEFNQAVLEFLSDK